MFKISPVQDTKLAKKYLEEIGSEYREGAFVYSMTDLDSGELMGASQFEITSEGGYIYDLKPKLNCDDFEAMFILGRQTMNFIDLCGSHSCRAAITGGEERLMLAIGFKRICDEYFCDMKGMFDGHCSGHKVEIN